jgi:NADH-quinone oxidoreductase subunit F
MEDAMNYASMKANADKQWHALENFPQPVIYLGMGTCGRAAGGESVLTAIDRGLKRMGVLGRIIEVGCIGMCYLEPMMAVRKAGRPFILYANLTPEKADKILSSYLLNNDPKLETAISTLGEGSIEGLPRFSELPMIRPQVRIALRNCGLMDPENINHYIARGGYSGLQKALLMTPEDVIQTIKDSGLRGRGGAGFPTGVKWGFARNAQGKSKYFICNADEGDPGAFMDRSLLEGDPHSVLEGMLIGAYAIGAKEGYVYVRAEYPLAIRHLEAALKQMEKYGLLGRNILGSDFDFHVKIKKGAGAFVCGEETALMGSIEGSRGMPRSRPPFPAQAGLWGMPTNINNVETLSNVSAILERGAAWYASYGTEKSRGTKTFSLAGNVNRTGLIEVPLGISLGQIIYDIGGGVPGGKKLKAVQTGGPSGGCIPASLLNLSVDYEALAAAGSIMGSGGMVVMDEDTCMVDMARYFLGFTHSESCGKCLPCRLGTKQMLAILEDICGGKGRPEDLKQLETLSEAIHKGSLCGLGQTSPNPVLTTMRYFLPEYEAHIHEKQCPATVCSALFTAPCQHACPVGMDIPAYVALAREGRLGDAYRVMSKTNPFPRVCGRVCDHPCQARCRRGTLDEPVAIKNIKRYVSDHAQPASVGPLPVTFKERIAVIGAGPAGLAAARSLRMRGYGVTLFEALPEPGGMMRYAIPEYRLPKDILRKETDAILGLGVELRVSTRVGEDIPWFMILDEYEAIFLAIGAQRSTQMGIAGETLKGVHGAIEFLRQVNSSQPIRAGERVAVVGGGNAAIDAARTALRLGGKEVHILYRRLREDMPAFREEILAAEEEGITLHFLVSPIEIGGSNGRVKEVVCRRMTLGGFDSSGRKRPILMEESAFTLSVDQMLIAIGQSTELPFGVHRSGIEISRGGLVSVLKGTTSRTSHPKVFAGGDVVTGPYTVIRAVAAGQKAASEIDEAIRRKKGLSSYVAPREEEIPVSKVLDEEVAERAQERMPLRSLERRVKGFHEVELGYTPEQAVVEASRCLRCDIQIDESAEEAKQPREAAVH